MKLNTFSIYYSVNRVKETSSVHVALENIWQVLLYFRFLHSFLTSIFKKVIIGFKKKAKLNILVGSVNQN